VEEVTLASEVHGHASGLGCSDYFFVANRSTWLHYCAHASIDENLKAVCEREECVAGSNRAPGTGTGALNCKLARVNAVYLAHANANRCAFASQQDSVGLHCAAGTPSELELFKGGCVCLRAGNQLPVIGVELGKGVWLLNQQASTDLANL
jgi:hypothetical protein